MNEPFLTITGADDRFDTLSLAFLMRDLGVQDVEWAFLISAKQAGCARYPTWEWLRSVVASANHHSIFPRIALHLCGRIARGFADGLVLPSILEELAPSRIQINGWEPAHETDSLWLQAKKYGVPMILQCRSEQTLQQVCEDVERVGSGTSVLFDVSGGSGRSPERWPERPPIAPGVRVGYAGGITPATVRNVLSQLGPREGMWIDCESGVRTNDELDVAKVRQLVENVRAFRAGK